jgi:hypothetical protein
MMDDLSSIEQSLRCRLGTRVREIQLRVEPHGLVIVGQTASYYDKQLAQHIVKELCGWHVAENRIAVERWESPVSEPSVQRTHHRLHRGGTVHRSQAGHRRQDSTSLSFFDER